MTAPSGTVRFLGAMLFGQLIIWDLPSAAFMKRLRRPDLVLHHLGLAVVALVATSLPVFYYSWFIGLSEASTVPLAANDLFDELHNSVEAADPNSPRLPRLAFWRDTCQMFAALSFVAVRVLGWAWVVWLLFRDTLIVLPTSASLGLRGFLRGQLVLASGFFALQLFWFRKLVAYTLTSGFGGSVPEDELTWDKSSAGEE